MGLNAELRSSGYPAAEGTVLRAVKITLAERQETEPGRPARKHSKCADESKLYGASQKGKAREDTDGRASETQRQRESTRTSSQFN